jgi:hypothetical protein
MPLGSDEREAWRGQGEHAHRIWNMIYSQSCFNNVTDKDVCAERKVFYRLISGGFSIVFVGPPLCFCRHALRFFWVGRSGGRDDGTVKSGGKKKRFAYIRSHVITRLPVYRHARLVQLQMS